IVDEVSALDRGVEGIWPIKAKISTSTMSLNNVKSRGLSVEVHGLLVESQNTTILLVESRTKIDTFHPIIEVEQVEVDSEDSDNIILTEYDIDNNNTSEFSAQENLSIDDNDFLNIFENYSHPIFDFDTP
ncbi:9116_t:CDS:2, partial [Funneliformis mosseae]